MSIKRRDLIKYLEENLFHIVREGGNHTIYSNGIKVIPVKRHRQFDRITANEIDSMAVFPQKSGHGEEPQRLNPEVVSGKVIYRPG